MKFEDTSQNLRARLSIINVVVLLLLAVLGVRLYLLQIVRGKYYADIAENQRIRLLPIPAPRGVIFDRNGNVLVDSRPIYEVILSSEDVKSKDLASLVRPLSAGLGIDVQMGIDEARMDDAAAGVDDARSAPATQHLGLIAHGHDGRVDADRDCEQGHASTPRAGSAPG